MDSTKTGSGFPTRPDLESESTYARLDSTALRHRLKSLPEQCREAWEQGCKLTPPREWEGIDRIVVGGMGGSAIAGDLVVDLAASQRAVSVSVVRDFNLPSPMGRNCLFVASSHSGATRETLALFRQAREQSAPMLVLAGGGDLADEAAAAGVPMLRINAPGEPRSAIGYNLMLLLGALVRCGLLKVDEADVKLAISVLQRQVECLSEEIPEERNRAKQVARELVDKVVLVYGGGLFTGMARRWKTQLNENAKVWAFYESIPELLHNSVEAYSNDESATQGKIILVLKPASESSELARRYDVLSELLKRRKIAHQIIESEPGPLLAQQLSMLAMGDYVSYYLALLSGVDPSPTPTLDLGKDLMRDGS